MALSGVFNQFIETFKKLSTLQRVSLLAATVAVFASVVVLVLWANKPIYKTLYAELGETDLEETTTALDGKNVPYRLVNGNTIEVPAEDVYATRIALALDGIPAAETTGFELFDDPPMGMTEGQYNVNYLRGLQGELSRSITTINEVVEAKVHLVIPRDRIFIQENEEAKASVVVRVLPGATLRQPQVKAIAHLVSSAVKGLSPEQVQILDTNGNLLSEFLTDTEDSTLISQTQREYQREVEKDIEQKVLGILSPLGTGNFVARVSVEMDFNRKEIMSEIFEGDPIVRSQRTLEENSRNTGQGPAGVPGVEPNLAEPDILIDGVMSEYSKTDETTNYEISRRVTNEVSSGGVISRLTVSVIVDDKPQLVDENGTQTIIKQPWADDEIAKIKTAVASAVGFNAERGDTVDITNLAYNTTADGGLGAGAVSAADARREQIMTWVNMGAKYLAAVVIILLFYLLLLRPILKRLDNAKELDDELLGESAIDAQLASLDIAVGGDSGFPKTVEELEREIESELNESVPVDVEAVKSKVMLKKIEEAANEDPEMIANLVKAMIKGG